MPIFDAGVADDLFCRREDDEGKTKDTHTPKNNAFTSAERKATNFVKRKKPPIGYYTLFFFEKYLIRRY
jgi:hypothetical protein